MKQVLLKKIFKIFTKCVLSELKLGSNSRASREYRQKIAKVLIKRAFLQLKEDVYGN